MTDPSSRDPAKDKVSLHHQGGTTDEGTLDASTDYARHLSLQASNLVGQKFGQFEILSELSVGGMGAVYKAQQLEPIKRNVALKVIKFESVSAEWSKRFDAERQAMALMDHPNIAKIYDGGTTPTGTPYLSMELVDGQPFISFLDTAKMSVKDRLELFVQICRAVQHAHDKGIIHRDLKPSNVLVTRVDGRPAAKVIDFGLAKSIDPEQRIADTELTMHGHVMGTMNYMSPEQAAGETVDGQTDVYSLGVMLYEALVGSTPIDVESLRGLRPLDALELVREHVASKPSTRLNQSGAEVTSIAQSRSTSPASLRSILTGELDWVVLQAIDKDKKRRYATVQAMADDVERYLNHEAVRARPPSIMYKAGKFVRRNRTWVSFASIAAVVLLAFGILVPMLMRSQRESSLSSLEKALLRTPGQFELTPEELQTQKDLILQISAIDPVRGAAADAEMHKVALEALTVAIESPRLRVADYERYSAVLKGIATTELDATANAKATELNGRLQELQGQWLTVANASSGDDLLALFPQGSAEKIGTGIRTTETTVVEPKTPRAQLTFDYAFLDRTPLTDTLVQFQGNARATAVFKDWQDTEVGISLRVGNELGYEFVLRPGDWNLSDAAEVSNPPSADPGYSDPSSSIHIVEIRRENTPLLRAEISTEQLSLGGLISLQAVRERNTLSLKIGQGEYFEVFDPFPLSLKAAATVGIRSTSDSQLTSLRCESKQVASASLSGLLAGDAAYGLGDFEKALDAYATQLQQKRISNAARIEANYKMALCLQRLNRADEARQTFERVESQQISPWNALASIQIWEAATEDANFAQQVEAFNRMRALQSTADLAGLIPPETRGRILQKNLKPMQIGDLLKSDPNRLDRVSFAAELDRVLSSDGRGTLAGQFEYSRVLRFEGRLEEAAEVLQDLNDRFKNGHVAGIYARVLRLLDQPHEALKFLESSKDRIPNFQNIYLGQMPLCHFAIGRNELGDRGLRDAVTKSTDNAGQSKAYIALGFRLWHQGDVEGAKKIWKKGYAMARQHSRAYEDANQASHVHVLILGSLSDSLQPEDSDRFVRVILQNSKSPALQPILAMALPPQKIHGVFSRMWKSDFGLQVAEDMAFERLSLRERTLGPLQVAAYQVVVEDAFAERPSAKDQVLAVEAVKELIRLWLDKHVLSVKDIGFLYAAWSGFASVPANLPEAARAKFHYLLGHKKLQAGNAADAKRQIESARTGAEDGSLLAERSNEMSMLLDAGRGILQIRCEPEIASSCQVLDESGTAVPLRDGEELRNRELPPGKYSLRNDAVDWSADFEVKLGQTENVSVPWKWAPRKAPGKLKGLLSHPAALTNHEHWQLVQTSMEASCFDLAWSPDGKSIAIVGDEYLRIADPETFEYTDAIPVTGEQLRTVSWSSQGILATGTVDGRVFMLNGKTQRLSETPKRFPAKIYRMSWNPSGDLLAVCGQDSDVYIYDGSGDFVRDIRGITGIWMTLARWSPDGEALAIGGHNRVVVYKTANWNLVMDQDGVNVCYGVLWSNDSQRFVVVDNKQFRLFDLKERSLILKQPLGEFVGGASMIWGKDETTVLANGRGSNGLIEWDLAPDNPAPLQRRPVNGYSPLRISPDGSKVAIGNPNGTIVRDRLLSRELGCIGKHLKVMFRSSDYCASRDLLSVVDYHEGEAVVLDLTSNTSRYLDRSHRYSYCSWSKHGQLLAACTPDGQVIVFNDALDIVAQLKLAEERLLNIDWFKNDVSLVVSSESGRLVKLNVIQSEDGAVQLQEEATISEGDDKPTNWEGTRLIASPDSLAGAYYRNRQLSRFTLSPTIECSELEQLSLYSLHNFSYVDDDRILSNAFGRIVSHELVNAWMSESIEVLDTPTCFARESRNEVLFGSNDGRICRYNFHSGEVTKLVDTGMELYDLHKVSEDEVLAINLYGTIRKINIGTGQVEKLIVVTRDAPVLIMSGGGKLLSSPESLSEFSCIVEKDGHTTLVPAAEVLAED